jgi:REP element-mobilizing transposase RayT
MAGKHLSVLIHFIWSTAGREPWIASEWRDRLYGYIGGVLREKNATLLSAGGMPDHIHLYVSIPSTVTLADLVSAMKANSSRWVHETFPRYRAFAWQKGYGAFSVGKSAEVQLLEYIRHQEEHHRKRDFKEEYLSFLKRYGVDHDERYLWE